jgi:hypothetical protein
LVAWTILAAINWYFAGILVVTRGVGLVKWTIRGGEDDHGEDAYSARSAIEDFVVLPPRKADQTTVEGFQMNSVKLKRVRVGSRIFG